MLSRRETVRLFFHRMATVESFAGALLLGETLFGVCAGMTVHALFGNGTYPRGRS